MVTNKKKPDGAVRLKIAPAITTPPPGTEVAHAVGPAGVQRAHPVG